uniref:Uncharacterized protein n=1 Tax=Strongyloides papillosus TaxID=174720 RepID=A0A0N5CDY4_STREA
MPDGVLRIVSANKPQHQQHLGVQVSILWHLFCSYGWDFIEYSVPQVIQQPPPAAASAPDIGFILPPQQQKQVHNQSLPYSV